MTVSLELTPDQEAALIAHAEARHATVDQVLLEWAEPHIQPLLSTEETNAQKRIRLFRDWVASLDPTLPVLSDEAMSRESIYPDLP